MLSHDLTRGHEGHDLMRGANKALQHGSTRCQTHYGIQEGHSSIATGGWGLRSSPVELSPVSTNQDEDTKA
ncbi:hypothetical protein Pdw03_1541 [Penicillium digitatum]|uniref:Uncharacterized protein n=1 Tax=Penicillium digitatum TaxID=36651 RepID=A0A7T6XSK9_PENDI|nr:hypothetical protein Pdw03_1541 [Penicillium digitatum]